MNRVHLRGVSTGLTMLLALGSALSAQSVWTEGYAVARKKAAADKRLMILVFP